MASFAGSCSRVDEQTWPTLARERPNQAKSGVEQRKKCLLPTTEETEEETNANQSKAALCRSLVRLSSLLSAFFLHSSRREAAATASLWTLTNTASAGFTWNILIRRQSGIQVQLGLPAPKAGLSCWSSASREGVSTNCCSGRLLASPPSSGQREAKKTNRTELAFKVGSRLDSNFIHTWFGPAQQLYYFIRSHSLSCCIRPIHCCFQLKLNTNHLKTLSTLQPTTKSEVSSMTKLYIYLLVR